MEISFSKENSETSNNRQISRPVNKKKKLMRLAIGWIKSCKTEFRRSDVGVIFAKLWALDRLFEAEYR